MARRIPLRWRVRAWVRDAYRAVMSWRKKAVGQCTGLGCGFDEYEVIMPRCVMQHGRHVVLVRVYDGGSVHVVDANLATHEVWRVADNPETRVQMVCTIWRDAPLGVGAERKTRKRVARWLAADAQAIDLCLAARMHGAML